MNVKKVFRAMALIGVILAASINLNAQTTKVSDTKASDTKTSNVTASDVTADQKEATALTLSPEKITLAPGTGTTLKVTQGIKEGEKIAITWKSSNEKVATVTKDGNVKTITEGKTIITATAGDKTGKCEVTVSIPNITK